MLNTLRATVTPAGTIVFDEAVDVTHPTAVLVTLLEEPVVEPKAETEDPLSWQLTDEEKRIWDEFPEFRRQHPVNFNSMETTE
ncbi:hypothetical protein Thiowin_03265 [Thiorhodovibrio winogradskyi]|uniref:Uncharacterized protein n=1 Tax=Thiorhodovibrio winogradskyi TaxID=77007 RepID=A0ABZ0SDS3_9GAMM|nr:hypothetical protein [Thiorhodovibrio winogradskyi]